MTHRGHLKSGPRFVRPDSLRLGLGAFLVVSGVAVRLASRKDAPTW